MFQDLLKNAFTPVALAVATIFVSWLQARSHSGRLGRLLEQNTKMLAFIENWLKFNAQVEAMPEGANRDTAEKMLAKMLSEVESAFDYEAGQLGHGMTQWGAFRNAFLLRQPRKAFLWIPQIAFYILLVSVCMFTVGAWLKPDSGVHDVSVFLLLVLLLFIVRSLAVHFG